MLVTDAVLFYKQLMISKKELKIKLSDKIIHVSCNETPPTCPNYDLQLQIYSYSASFAVSYKLCVLSLIEMLIVNQKMIVIKS